MLGERFTVLEFEAGTRSAADAAAAIGCAAAEIAKSMVFRTATSGPPRLVVASGDKRVTKRKRQRQSERKFAVRMPISCAKQGLQSAAYPRRSRAAADRVIDETLLRFDNIWAAASTPNAVFCLTPADLVAMTSGLIVDVANG